MRNSDYKLPDYKLDPPDDPEDYRKIEDDDAGYDDKKEREEADYYYELHRWSYKSKNVMVSGDD
jgi:hypothetical protein